MGVEAFEMKPLRTAILGCGRFAKKHAVILAARPEIELVGFCDRELENARAYNQQYTQGQGQVFQEYAEMFDRLALDLVYICLPPYAHENEVELACRRGVHYLIEKPIALSMDLACKMAEWTHAGGVKSQVGFMYRFGAAAQWLKQQLEAQSQDGQAFLMGRYACNALHSWWWRDRTRSGGQLVEQVIHLLDLARFFLGEPRQVYSVQENLFHQGVEGYTIEDASITTIRFASGALGVLTATNGAIPNRWDCDWRLCLPGLTADFTDANHAVFHQTHATWPSTINVAAEKDLYLAETLDLIEAIRDDRPTAVPIDEGVRSLSLALTAAESARRSQPVDINEPDNGTVR
jgi:predicted dehydrogenase